MTAPNLPVHLQQYATPDITDRLAGNLGAGTPPYLSIRENRFTLYDAGGDSEPITTVDPKTGIPYVDCCVVDVGDHASKIYYDQPFSPNEDSWRPPTCWSDNGVAPSVQASEPQSATCAGCPKAVWGSATSKMSGKGIPACGKYQKLAIILPDDDVTFLLRVPPNSLDNLRTYNLKFRGQAFSIRDVMTRISFVQGQIGTLSFQALDFINEAMAKQRQAVISEKKTDLLVGRGDKPIGSMLPAPGGAQASPTPGAAAQNAASQSTVTASQQTQNAPTATAAASPSEQPVAGRRRRRSQAEIAADNARTASPPNGGASAAGGQAPFRPDPLPATGETAAAPAGGQGSAFGISPGVEPDPAMAAALKSVFG